MGCCFSSIPDVHSCKECKICVIESYPHTRCPKCETILHTTKKEPKPFALPKTNNGQSVLVIPMVLVL